MKIKSPRSLFAALTRTVRAAPAKGPSRRPVEGDRFEPRVRPRRLHLHPRPGHRPPAPRGGTPDVFNPGPRCGTNGGGGVTPTPVQPGPRCGTNGGTPAPAPSPSTAPSGPAAGGGCSSPNPFEGGRGLAGPVSNGPFFSLGKPDADLTWDGLAKLFAEGKVIGDTGGSCGMTGAEKVEALRSFWDQCVASGKSPAESGFFVRCGPNGVPGLHT